MYTFLFFAVTNRLFVATIVPKGLSQTLTQVFDNVDQPKKGEWRPDGTYEPDDEPEISPKHDHTYPEYTYMGLPYGTLLLTKTAPRKQYSVRKPDINPSSYFKQKTKNNNPKNNNPKNNKKSKIQITPLSNPLNSAVCDLFLDPGHPSQNNNPCKNNPHSNNLSQTHTKLYQKAPEQVQVGERNSYLTSAQGYYSRKGLSGQELMSKILELNAQIANPLSETEVSKITYYPNFNNSNLSTLHASKSESLKSGPLRKYVIDTQQRMDFNVAWMDFRKTYKFVKTGNKKDIILPAEITILFKVLYPESKLMFKSDHALVCTIGRKLAYERFTWENEPNGMLIHDLRTAEVYAFLNQQEVVHAESNKSRITIRSKQLKTYGLDPNLIEFKTENSQNRGYEGYKIVVVHCDSKDNQLTLENLLYELYSLEGEHWNVDNKYFIVCVDKSSTVSSILNKLKDVERRNQWYFDRIKRQWHEAMLLSHPPDVDSV